MKPRRTNLDRCRGEAGVHRPGRGLRLVGGLLVLLLVSAACGADDTEPPTADDTEPPTAELTPLNVAMYQGLLVQQNTWVAQETGIFEAHGLDVQFVPIESGPAGIAAVEGGSVDVGSANMDLVLLANQEGTDLRVICGSSGTYFEVIAGPGLDLPNVDAGYPAVMEDFVGKNLGVAALGSSNHLFWLVLFEAAGIDPDLSTYVGVGAGAPVVEGLRAGTIDAYIGFDPAATLITEGGVGGTIALDLRAPASEGPPEVVGINPMLIYFASNQLIDEKFEAYQAFNAALMEAAEFQSQPENLQTVVDIIRENVPVEGLSDEAYAAMVEANISAVTSSALEVTPEGVAAWLNVLQSFGEYPEDADRAAIIDETTWESAC